MCISIKILDAPMGKGKTSAMLNYINEAPDTERFIFITPFLNEDKRVIAACPQRNFQAPEAYDDPDHPNGDPRSKFIDFKKFLKRKDNIVSTHALFSRFDPETIQLILDGGYTLIMDEVADVTSVYDISPKDARMMSRMYVDADENKMLIWKDQEKDYWGLYEEIKRLCDTGCLYKYNDSRLLKFMPIDAFRVFDNVFIMTYMFDAQIQRMYMDFFGLEYEYVYVTGHSPETYRITDIPQDYSIPHLKNLIHICDDKKLNFVGEYGSHARYNLSLTWFDNPDNEEMIKTLKNNVANYFRHKCNAPAEAVLWTTFKEKHNKWDRQSLERKPYFTPKSYGSGWLACNSRATNAYRDRYILAYAANRFMSPEIRNFFANVNIHIDVDRWALSEMIQWIWRSAIRDGKEIWIYIPSARMRHLLENWIEEVSMPQLVEQSAS